MNNLSNEIVHLSKVLEKQIPKGYHEIVTEYVRQNIASALYDLLAIVICLLVAYFIIRIAARAVQDKEGSVFFDSGYSEPDLSSFGAVAVFGAVLVSIAILIIFIAAFLNVQTAIQHAVAPNYYLIKSFIK